MPKDVYGAPVPTPLGLSIYQAPEAKEDRSKKQMDPLRRRGSYHHPIEDDCESHGCIISILRWPLPILVGEPDVNSW